MIPINCSCSVIRKSIAACAALLVALAVPGICFGQAKSTEWGWPLPYERVSDKSVQWLKDKNIPVTAIAIESPNLLHALVVPNDSPLKSIKDLKGSNPPATVGLVTGLSC